jgi:uncharacterized repeat protein (TIGR04138 family)
MQHQGLLEVVRRDPRYAYEAYEFLFEALRHTQHRLNRVPPEDIDEAARGDYHVAGRELVDGYLDLAKQRFGRLARVVLHLWGVDITDDIGELVFNLIESDLLSKTDSDCKSDFCGICDLDDVLVNRFEIAWER